jgi:DNA topoisomerase I
MGEWRSSLKVVIVASSVRNTTATREAFVPARKKQPIDGEAPGAPARKKPASAAKKPTLRKRKPASPPTNGDGAEVLAEAPGRSRAGKPDLVIVESPTKAKTINKYLGGNYIVRASYGHVRDLPRRRRKGELIAGIDIDAGWVPTYVVQEKEDGKGKGKSSKFVRRTPKEILAELKREAAKCNRVYLATDPDREGEAIAWHIEDELGLDDARTFRVAFNEITRTAILKAMAAPGKINMDRVKAQEARRILDRVVGYPLSNLLSKKVTKNLSAGRVQSVALRLVVDREREIEAFKPEEYWKITALFAPHGTARIAVKPVFTLTLAKPRGAALNADKNADDSEEKKPTGPESPEGTFFAELTEWAGKKFEVADQPTAAMIATALDQAAYKVAKIDQKDALQYASAPFITSTLQQMGSQRLHFNAEKTMRIAQKLYEGIDLGSEGSVALITYMRTDSTRVSDEALSAVRDLIDKTYGKAYLPAKPNTFKSGKSAQEAHEAIRPTDLDYTPDRVSRLLPADLPHRQDYLRLYTLIYHRFVASQMTPAIFAVTNVIVEAAARLQEQPIVGLFKAQGRILKFDGFRKVLAPAGKQEDAVLPALSEQQKLDRLDLTASQHFTQPPPRYNERSLIGALEKEGIGRPSTYASIIAKITDEERGYIQVKEQRRFYATELGKKVTDLLVKHFARVMDVKFTSHMEEELDEIETKKTQYNQVLTEFWGPFSEALKLAEVDMAAAQETGEKCPVCGRPLVIKYARLRKREFIGCSGYKEGCKYIKPVEGEEPRPEPVVTDVPCPVCAKPMLKRMGKRGEFLSCSGYPDCKTTMNFDAEGKPVLASRPTQHVCEKCGKEMVIREGPRGPFLACTGYPKCRNAKDVDAQGNIVKPIDLGINCEKCGSPMAVRKGPRGPFLGCTGYPKCRSSKPVPDDLKEKLKAEMPAPAPKKEVPQVEVSETCPECGSPMRLQLNRRRGNYFLGCSTYPKCKGTRQPSAELLEQLAETGAVTG